MKRTWALVDSSTFTVAGANLPVATDLLLNMKTNLETSVHDVTISAIRLNVGVKLTGTQTEFVTLCMGVIVMGIDALAVGTTSLPDPAEEHADWMAYASRSFNGNPGASGDDVIMHNIELHSDSMRKMRENRQTLALVVATQFNTLLSVTILPTGRVLVLGL